MVAFNLRTEFDTTYPCVEELQKELEESLGHYNNNRTHLTRPRSLYHL
jgi:hypothetical protein